MKKKFNIWEGSYKSFEEIDRSVDISGFNVKRYRSQTIKNIFNALSNLKKNKPIDYFSKQRSIYLPILITLLITNSKKIKILDFGGGLGISYLSLIEKIPGIKNKIDYTIIEIPTIVMEGKKIFKNKIKFIDKIPMKKKYDVVFSSSAIQYINNWKQTILKLINLQPKYLLFSDVFAGKINTFATLQKYYNTFMPHWFFNEEYFLDLFYKNKYTLVFRDYVAVKRLEFIDELPMENFPKKKRISRTLHLLFKRDLK